jgi:hypothetical protein
MSFLVELPEELANALATEASRLGLSLPDYATRLLASASPRTDHVRSGADLVAYWQAEGVVGTHPTISDSQTHARSLRERAERRHRE